MVQYTKILHTSLLTEPESKWEFELTKDTPNLALAGELWSVFCDGFGEK